MRSHSANTSRVASVGAAACLVAAASAVGLQVAQAGDSTCHAQNVTSGGAASANLQSVIDNASAGDTVQVKGTCVGGIKISKDLRLVGKPTYAQPNPALDGDRSSRVLRVTGETSNVTLVDLTITRGVTSYGGGIYNRSGTVALRGSTSVTDNRADYGGGIYNLAGMVALSGSATVANNVATRSQGDRGGGIANYATVTMNGSSSVTDNSARHLGGGIYNYGTLTMNDSATVAGNAVRAHGGGIFNDAFGTLTLNDFSSVADNRAHRDGAKGGGIYNSRGNGEGVVTLSDTSSVTDNTATYGGGIFNYAIVVLRDASIVTNNVATSGGGIYGLNVSQLSACDATGIDEWVGAISPNTPDDPPSPMLITCS